MTGRERVVSTILGVVGGAVGGFIGFYGFGWALKQNFYAAILPGGLLGLGCGLMARHPSTIRGVFCGLAGLALGLYSEWHFRPFNADESLSYFLAHLNDLTGLSKLMIALGALIAFWLGKDGGYGRPAQPPAPPAREGS
jgi:hypothetical protein